MKKEDSMNLPEAIAYTIPVEDTSKIPIAKDSLLAFFTSLHKQAEDEGNHKSHVDYIANLLNTYTSKDKPHEFLYIHFMCLIKPPMVFESLAMATSDHEYKTIAKMVLYNWILL